MRATKRAKDKTWRSGKRTAKANRKKAGELTQEDLDADKARRYHDKVWQRNYRASKKAEYRRALVKADLITKNLPLTGGMTKEARREKQDYK